MKVGMLIDQLQKLDPNAEVWFVDSWPGPGEGWRPNAIIKESDGQINLAHTNKSDWEYFKEFGSDTDEVVFCDYADVHDDDSDEDDEWMQHISYLETMRELHNND